MHHLLEALKVRRMPRNSLLCVDKFTNDENVNVGSFEEKHQFCVEKCAKFL